MSDRAAFIAGLIGTPYDKMEHHCWWLVGLVERELAGISLPVAAYAGRHERARILAAHPERTRWRQVPRPADLDVVLMARAPGQDIHAGVYLADRRGVIHTDDPHGVVVDTMLELEQSRRWRVSIYRLAGAGT